MLDFLGFSVLAWEIFKCFGRGRLVSVLPKIRSYEFAERKGYDFISESLSLFIGRGDVNFGPVALYFSCIRVIYQISALKGFTMQSNQVC